MLATNTKIHSASDEVAGALMCVGCAEVFNAGAPIRYRGSVLTVFRVDGPVYSDLLESDFFAQIESRRRL
jgi:hypothetical protein